MKNRKLNSQNKKVLKDTSFKPHVNTLASDEGNNGTAQKVVGTVLVGGKQRDLYRGSKGGTYYKTKSGHNVYLNKDKFAELYTALKNHRDSSAISQNKKVNKAPQHQQCPLWISKLFDCHLFSLYSYDIEEADLFDILNGFNEYISQHENEDENQKNKHLSHCDISKCVSFQRNYRIREINEEHDSIMKLYHTKDSTQIAHYQLLDKIHCFLHHQKKNALFFKSQIKKRMCQRFSHQSDQKSFIFGREFDYDSHGYYIDDDSSRAHISQKYKHLKTELIQNKYCPLTLQQYESEYTKAKVTQNTRQSKAYCPEMSIQHLLCLMVYCNYDSLQFEFSKTYRDNGGMEHSHFCHFGRFLKEAVLNHGTTIIDTPQKRFYHGISEPLVPEEIVGDLGKGVSVFCPLSTSTSRTVALNIFTNEYEGVVIEFGGKRSKAKYFNVAWLSDFANENECLFLQNKEALRINNITHCQSGREYKHILDALKMLDSILAVDYHEPGAVIEIKSESMKMLIHYLEKIAKKITTCNNCNCEGDNKEDEYAKQLIDVYVNGKTVLNLNYSVLERDYTELFELFCNKDCKWIDVSALSSVFPNVVNVTVKNIHLSHVIMNQIWRWFLMWDLDKMTVATDEHSALTVSAAVAHYQQTFNGHQMTLTRVETANVDSFVVKKKEKKGSTHWSQICIILIMCLCCFKYLFC